MFEVAEIPDASLKPTNKGNSESYKIPYLKSRESHGKNQFFYVNFSYHPPNNNLTHHEKWFIKMMETFVALVVKTDLQNFCYIRNFA